MRIGSVIFEPFYNLFKDIYEGNEVFHWNRKSIQIFNQSIRHYEFIDSEFEQRYLDFLTSGRGLLNSLIFILISMLQLLEINSAAVWTSSSSSTWWFETTKVSPLQRGDFWIEILTTFALLGLIFISGRTKGIRASKDALMHIVLFSLLHFTMLKRSSVISQSLNFDPHYITTLITVTNLIIVGCFAQIRFKTSLICSALVLAHHVWFALLIQKRPGNIVAFEGIYVVTLLVLILITRYWMDRRARQIFFFLSSLSTSHLPQRTNILTSSPEHVQELVSNLADSVVRTVPLLDALNLFRETRIARTLLESTLFKLTATYGKSTGVEKTLNDEVREFLDLYSGVDTSETNDQMNAPLRSRPSSSKSTSSLRKPDRLHIRRKTLDPLSATGLAHRLREESFEKVRRELSHASESPKSVRSNNAEPNSVASDGPIEGEPPTIMVSGDPDEIRQTALMTFLDERKSMRITCDLGRHSFNILEIYRQADSRGAFDQRRSEFLESVSNAPAFDKDAWERIEFFDKMVDSFEYTQFMPILEMGYPFLVQYLGGQYLNSDPGLLVEVLIAIEFNYLDNPYHNSFHAAQVMQSAIWLSHTVCPEGLTEFESVCFAFACLVHDIGHPGRTNGNLIIRQNPMATLYNDEAVLENYHAALFFNLLTALKQELFPNMKKNELYEMRKFIIRCILATDMSSHFDILDQWKRRAIADDFDPQSTDRTGLFKILIKAGDLSHGALPWIRHREWSNRVTEELFEQGDEERSLGLPISPLCDRTVTEPGKYPKSQISFMKLIVLPLFTELNKLVNGDEIRNTCVKNVLKNTHRWKRLRDLNKSE